MSRVELWFPVAIYLENNLISAEQNDELVRYSLDLQKKVPTGGEDWYGNTYNTHGTYDLNKDSKFRPLLDIISMHVNQFAKMHNSESTYNIKYAWLNVNKKNTYQELHTHNACIFSCSYYLLAPPRCGGIVFEDPKEPDMFPLRSISEKNHLSYTTIQYPATSRTLIAFRSYLRHMVLPGTNTEPRISISVNFT